MSAALTQPATPAKLAMPPDVAVAKLLAMRAKIAEIRKRQTEELAPYNVAEAALEARLMEVLNQNSAKSMKVPAGTFYTSVHTSAKVESWSDALAYIREHEAWELLEARVSKTAVEAIVEETGAGIPGVQVNREARLNVRRA